VVSSYIKNFYYGVEDPTGAPYHRHHLGGQLKLRWTVPIHAGVFLPQTPEDSQMVLKEDWTPAAYLFDTLTDVPFIDFLILFHSPHSTHSAS